MGSEKVAIVTAAAAGAARGESDGQVADRARA